LHEATHCALDCAELDNSMLRSNAASTVGLTVPSPWSGNPLSPHALVHACAVWAVLLRFWEYYNLKHCGCEAVRARCLFIRRGFDSISPPTLLAPIDNFLTETAAQVVAIAYKSAQDSSLCD